MARLTIEDRWWTDPRREKLAELLGSLLLADAWAVRLWRLAQEHYGRGRKPIPAQVFDSLEAAPKLIQAGLVQPEHDGIYVRGSGDFLDWLNDKRASAATGGKKSAAKRREKYGSAQPNSPSLPKQARSTPEPKSNTPEPSGSGFGSGFGFGSGADSGSVPAAADAEPPAVIPIKPSKTRRAGEPVPTGEAWKAFKEAYSELYGIEPIQNATTNSQMANFVRRVGAEEAPLILRFYLTHKDWFYTKNAHPLGAALKDAEKLRTEWATGRMNTGTESRLSEKAQSSLSQLDRVKKGLL